VHYLVQEIQWQAKMRKGKKGPYPPPEPKLTGTARGGPLALPHCSGHGVFLAGAAASCVHHQSFLSEKKRKEKLSSAMDVTTTKTKISVAPSSIDH
jgi:hypothetical protein